MDIKIRITPKDGKPFTQTLPNSSMAEAASIYNVDADPSFFGEDGPDPSTCTFEFKGVDGENEKQDQFEGQPLAILGWAVTHPL
jgi:hypothetical protein